MRSVPSTVRTSSAAIRSSTSAGKGLATGWTPRRRFHQSLAVSPPWPRANAVGRRVDRLAGRSGPVGWATSRSAPPPHGSRPPATCADRATPPSQPHRHSSRSTQFVGADALMRQVARTDEHAAAEADVPRLPRFGQVPADGGEHDRVVRTSSASARLPSAASGDGEHEPSVVVADIAQGIQTAVVWTTTPELHMPIAHCMVPFTMTRAVGAACSGTLSTTVVARCTGGRSSAQLRVWQVAGFDYSDLLDVLVDNARGACRAWPDPEN